ncbi:MAG: alcohol dehydrogenase catalytic domain-containing protein [Nitrososphaeria archaeon]|nr:alcohol dehydrogenase catalytic domain-containing protein [Nitrososphaeria archaeon]
MKAAFIYAPRDLRVEEVDVPKIGDDEALIRVRACGVCFSDIRFYLGLKKYKHTGFGREYPGFTGHEWAGEVVEIGKNVENISIGDRIVPSIIIPCGRCRQCRRGRINLCKDKIFTHGGFAEYVKAPAKNLMKMPDGLGFEEAALTEPIACCLNAGIRSGIREGDEAIIIGDGFMGILNMMIAKLLGASVTLIGHHDERLELAQRLGADKTINSKNMRSIGELEKEVGGKADAVIVSVGNKHAIETGLMLVDDGGVVNLFAGTYPPEKIELDPNMIHYGEIILTGSNVAPPKLFKEALNVLASRKLNVEPLIRYRFRLEEVERAFEAVERREVIKAMIVP